METFYSLCFSLFVWEFTHKYSKNYLRKAVKSKFAKYYELLEWRSKHAQGILVLLGNSLQATKDDATEREQPVSLVVLIATIDVKWQFSISSHSFAV